MRFYPSSTSGTHEEEGKKMLEQNEFCQMHEDGVWVTRSSQLLCISPKSPHNVLFFKCSCKVFNFYDSFAAGMETNNENPKNVFSVSVLCLRFQFALCRHSIYCRSKPPPHGGWGEDHTEQIKLKIFCSLHKNPKSAPHFQVLPTFQYLLFICCWCQSSLIPPHNPHRNGCQCRSNAHMNEKNFLFLCWQVSRHFRKLFFSSSFFSWHINFQLSSYLRSREGVNMCSGSMRCGVFGISWRHSAIWLVKWQGWQMSAMKKKTRKCWTCAMIRESWAAAGLPQNFGVFVCILCASWIKLHSIFHSGEWNHWNSIPHSIQQLSIVHTINRRKTSETKGMRRFYEDEIEKFIFFIRCCSLTLGGEFMSVKIVSQCLTNHFSLLGHKHSPDGAMEMTQKKVQVCKKIMNEMGWREQTENWR